MIRMEIALILVLAFVAYIYFSAGRRHTLLHRTFSVLLVMALVHLVFDALTVYTVARLDSVPRPVNDVLHRLFIGSMVLVVYLFYQYIAVLIEEETGKPRRLDLAAKVYLAAAELGAALLPVHYAVTPQGNYSDGIHANVCYASVAFYLLLCARTAVRRDAKRLRPVGGSRPRHCHRASLGHGHRRHGWQKPPEGEKIE